MTVRAPLARNGASRLTRICNWLRATPPATVTSLQLGLWDGAQVTAVLWQWQRDDEMTCDELARQIDDAMQNYAEENGCKIDCKLAWLIGEEREWTSNFYKASPTDGAPEYDGSPKSFLVQEQRHKEAIVQIQLQSISHVQSVLSNENERLLKLLSARDNRTERIDNDNARLRDENTQLRGDLNEANAQIAQAEAVAEELAEKLEEAVKTIEELKKERSDDSKVVAIVAETFKPQLIKKEG